METTDLEKAGGIRDPPVSPNSDELTRLRATYALLVETVRRMKLLVHYRHWSSSGGWPHRRRSLYVLHGLMAIQFRTSGIPLESGLPAAQEAASRPQSDAPELVALRQRCKKLQAQLHAVKASHERMAKLWFAFARWRRRCVQTWSEELVTILEFSDAELAEMSVAPELKPKKPSLLARTAAQSFALWRKAADATVRMTNATVRMTGKSVEFWKARWRRKHRRKNKTPPAA